MRNIVIRIMVVWLGVIAGSVAADAQDVSSCAGNCEWERMMVELIEDPSAVSKYDIPDKVARADMHHLSYMANMLNRISPDAYEDESVARKYVDFLVCLIEEYGRKADFMKEISAGRDMEDFVLDDGMDMVQTIGNLRLIATILHNASGVEPMIQASPSWAPVNYGNLHFLERVLYGEDIVMSSKDPYYSDVLRRLCKELDIPFYLGSAEGDVLNRIVIIASENDVQTFSRIWKDVVRLRCCINSIWQNEIHGLIMSYAFSELGIDEYMNEFSKAVREYYPDEYAKMMIPFYSLRVSAMAEVMEVGQYIRELLSEGKPFAEYLPWACPMECRTEGFEEYREAFMRVCKFIVRSFGYEMNEMHMAQAQDVLSPLLEFFGAHDINDLFYIIGNFALELHYEGYNDAYTIIEDLLRFAETGYYDPYQMARIAVVYTDISYVKVEHIIDDILRPSISMTDFWHGGAQSEARVDAMLLTSFAALTVNKAKYLGLAEQYVAEVEAFIGNIPYDEKKYYYSILADVYSFMGQGEKARHAIRYYLADMFEEYEDHLEIGLFMSYYREGRYRDAMKHADAAVGSEGVTYPLYATESAFLTSDYKMAGKLADTYLHNRYLMTENLLMATSENKSDLNSLLRKHDVEALGATLESSYGKKACADMLASLIYDWNLISKGALLKSMQRWHSFMMENDGRMYGAYHLYNAFSEGKETEGVVMSGAYASVVSYELSDLIRDDYDWDEVVPRITSKDVSDRLDGDSYAIEFCSVEDRYYAVLVGKNYKSPKLFHLCSKDEILNVSADMFTEYLYDDPNSLKKLYDLVWEPVLSVIPEGSDVYCSLDGVLNLLNVELFCDDELRYAGDVYDIHRVSSTASLDEPVRIGDISNAVLYGNMNYCMNQTEITADSDKYIYNAAEARYRGAVVDFVVPREYLSETGGEVRSVAGLLGQHHVDTMIFEWNDGTEYSFKSLSGKDFDILHMATHGFWWGSDTDMDGRPLSPMRRSGLVLSGSDDEPLSSDKAGVLFAQEISELDLSSVDLLVLSACQTAGGEIQEDGVFGLQRGFKQAGVGTIVMTLWPVKSAMTQSLMIRMYENLAGGQNVREAFYNARAEIRRNYKPSDWGAFIILD